jgi:hypothetical protein
MTLSDALERAGVWQHALLRGLDRVDRPVHGLWIRAETVGQDERGNAERRTLFAGLWPARAPERDGDAVDGY